MELQGKTAIVTGSGRGIGEGIILEFAKEGANAIAMDRRLENAQGVADQIMAAGGKVIAVEADVTNKASLDAMVEQTLKVFGRLDILANNAGVPLRVEIGIIQKNRSKKSALLYCPGDTNRLQTRNHIQGTLFSG